MKPIILAMLFLFFLTFLTALIVLKRRIAAVVENPSLLKYFKIYNLPSEITPTLEKMLQADRHYMNLFELPVLFYATCLMCLILHLDSLTISACVWSFVLLRVLHLTVHLGKNSVKLRMRVFLAQWISLIIIWITIGYTQLDLIF